MKKIIAVDFYDLIWKAENPFSRDDMDALFCKYAEYGVDAVLWRVSVCGKLLYHSQTPDRYMGCKAQNSTGEKQWLSCVSMILRKSLSPWGKNTE